MANTYFQPGKWLTATAILLVIALGVAAFLNIEYSHLDNELKAERIQSESLFSKKIVLQKEIESLKKHLSKAEYSGKMDAAEIEKLRQRLKIEEEALMKSALTEKELQTKISEIHKMRNYADERNVVLQKKAQQLAEENSRLNAQLNEYRRREDELVSQLNSALRPQAAYFRIEALSGRKNRETSKASQADRILVSFNWPDATLGKNIYLVLSGPDNRPVDFLSGTPVAITLNGVKREIHPTAFTDIKLNDTRQRLDITLELKEKLPPGVYQADVYTDDLHLGGTEIHLR